MINKKEKSDYPFMKFPRALIENPEFFHISIEARTFLAMILDRANLSAINRERFTDKNGDIYVIFTLEQVCEKLGCSNTRAMRLFRELETNGMITRNRKNRLSPYRIYLTDTFYEIINRELPTSQNMNTRHHNSESHDFTECEDNKNKYNKNYISNNKSSIIGFERTEDEIKEQIEYDCLMCDANQKILDEIVMIISDVFNGTSPTVRIGRDEMPRGIVISRFCKLEAEHIVSIIYDLQHSKTQIRNIKQYLITMLYNEPATSECGITADFSFCHKTN